MVVDPDDDTADGLVRDMLEVLTSFCAHRYGRSGAHSRVLIAVRDAVAPRSITRSARSRIDGRDLSARRRGGPTRRWGYRRVCGGHDSAPARATSRALRGDGAFAPRLGEGKPGACSKRRVERRGREARRIEDAQWRFLSYLGYGPRHEGTNKTEVPV